MDAEMLTNIRANARRIRLINGISTISIAKAMGLKRDWMYKFEKGCIQNPKPTTLTKLAKALGVSLSDLIKDRHDVVLFVSPEENRKGMENLERIRKRKRCSKKSFELYLGLSEGYYYKCLSGKRNFGIRIWNEIADALFMDLRDLIGRNEK